MEVVALDAYPWVMLSNIGAMGYYTKTAFMQKPYISTSNYILKMSNYPKGDWCDYWDGLFYKYLVENESKLSGGAKVYLRNLAIFKKWPITKRNYLLGKVKEYTKTSK